MKVVWHTSLVTTLTLGLLSPAGRAQVFAPPPVDGPAGRPLLPPGVPVVPTAPLRGMPIGPVPAVPSTPFEPGASPVVPVLRVTSVAEFVHTFRPLPQGGTYQVVLKHPCTGCPVKVCFRLPPGCPRKIRCTRTGMEFRYGLCKAVVVRFGPDGSVTVRP